MKKRTVIYKSFAVTLSGDDQNTVHGVAAAYGNIDKHNDVIGKGAFTKTLNERPRVHFLWQHKMDRPIGLITRFENGPDGLEFWAKFSSTPDGQMARQNMLEGIVTKFSVGFMPVKMGNQTVNGRRVNQIEEAVLVEISAVTEPANDMARLIAVKAAQHDIGEETLAELVEACALQLAEGSKDAPDAPQGVTEGEEVEVPGVEAQNDEYAPESANPSCDVDPDAEARSLAIKSALDNLVINMRLNDILDRMRA